MAARAGGSDHDVQYAALRVLVDLVGRAAEQPVTLDSIAAALAPAIPFDECLLLSAASLTDSAGAVAVTVVHCGSREVLGAPEQTSAGGIDWQVLGQPAEAVILEDLESVEASAFAPLFRPRGIRSACLLRIGPSAAAPAILCLGSLRPAAFSAADLGFLETAARLVAIGREGCGDLRAPKPGPRGVESDRDQLRELLEVSNAVAGTLDPAALRAAISIAMRRIIPFDFVNLLLLDSDGRRIGVFSLDPDVPQGMDAAVASIRIEDTPFADPAVLRAPFLSEPRQMTFLPDTIREDVTFRSMKRFCVLPLTTTRRTLGALALSSRSSDAFAADLVQHAAQAARQVAIAIENALAFQEIAALKDRLAEENLYLEEEIRGRNEFEEIVGESRTLQQALAQVRSVAGTETTVLLLGETGTGKELFARAIHGLSARRARTLVAVNCAASPAALLESEWFGYEKGAFTGALARKAGRFELADGGTLFLDEIGDIPLDLQAKLLRVLQEHEVERLGTTKPVRVDFRLVAATNADLPAMVTDRKFRSDLFYRLNVFPIRIPPLRERREDIPPLVTCFTQRYAKRLKRGIDSIPRETMDALCRWPWPGNVRELQNVIERAVILSPGRTLLLPATEFSTPAPAGGTLESAEREHIHRALVDTKWVVGGPNGAAARLGLRRTTLASTMKRLGIERPEGR